MKTSIRFIAKELTRNGGSGLPYLVTFADAQTGKVVDKVYVATEGRALQIVRNSRI